MTRFPLLSIVCLLFFVFPPPIFSSTFISTDYSEKRELWLNHHELAKNKVLKEGKKIKVWVQGSEEPIKGKFSVVNDSTIAIGNRSIPISKIEVLRVPLRATQALGAILMTPAALFTGLGIGMLSQGKANGSPNEGQLFVFGMISLFVGGSIAAAVSPLFFLGRKFQLGIQWKLFVN